MENIKKLKKSELKNICGGCTVSDIVPADIKLNDHAATIDLSGGVCTLK